jgi:cysteine desulfuration protein SufE
LHGILTVYSLKTIRIHMPMLPAYSEIIDNISYLEEWDDRYRYVIELGRMLPPLPEEAHTEENKVRGCASQVWLLTQVDRSGSEPVLTWQADSDAHIVRGLVALLLAMHNGKTAQDVLATDALAAFRQIGLAEHLTPQRSNGVRSMVARMQADARAALVA